MKQIPRFLLSVSFAVAIVFCAIAAGTVPMAAQTVFRPDIPKTWDEARLADWPTPLAGINVSPTHISSTEKAGCPVDRVTPSCLCREPLHRL